MNKDDIDKEKQINKVINKIVKMLDVYETHQDATNYSINVNKIKTYYDVGKLITQAENEYGRNMKVEYSFMLAEDLGEEFLEKDLYNMQKFYNYIGNGMTLDYEVGMDYYKILLQIDDINEINYYIKLILNNKLPKNKLRNIIRINKVNQLHS